MLLIENESVRDISSMKNVSSFCVLMVHSDRELTETL